ncbi:MAG: serine hydrolase domain-containing protein [Bacteroidota bacterium]
MTQFRRSIMKPGFWIAFLLILLLPSHLQSRESTADFLDGMFRSQMKEHSIAGATLSMFSADTLTITRGWGHSHIESSRLVNENTGFHIGSVSKLFVWVSVMQLVEQNRLDLNKPVNDYLQGNFRLPDHYSPVTMKHLMTHTPGFEDNMHVFSKSYDALPELVTYLDENLPLQIYEPGTTPAYSNYGVALAAYVIEQITGQTFNDYVEENVFAPLEMTNTTFRQPASFNISEAKSKGYVFRKGKFTSPFDEYILPAPAGSAVSTASDMLKFMIALLDCDEHNRLENNILQHETIAQMLSVLHAPHPQADGMAHGFMRMNYHGKNILWHGGDTYFFHTAFVLVPEMQTGIFFSINTAETKFSYIDQFLLILDFINGNKKELNANRRVNGLHDYPGTYKMSRRVESNYLKIFFAMITGRITQVPEGLLLTSPMAKPMLFKPYEEDIFVHEHRKLIFERNDEGQVDGFMVSDLPIVTFQQVSFRESAAFNMVLLILVLLIGLRNILIPLWRFLKRDKRSRQLYRWFLLLSGAAIWLFCILFLTTFSGVETIIFERPSGLRLILLLPWISALFFVAALFAWFQGGIGSSQPLQSTLWQFAGFIVMVVFYLQMHYWHFFMFWV